MSGSDHRRIPAQLRREPITRVDGRVIAEYGLQPVVVVDQRAGTRPRREPVQRLHERHADHRTQRVAGTARPSCLLQRCDQPDDLGRVEQVCDLFGVPTREYGRSGHWRCNLLLVRPPRCATIAGAIYLGCCSPFYGEGKTLNRAIPAGRDADIVPPWTARRDFSGGSRACSQ